jgi:hypothetical protein
MVTQSDMIAALYRLGLEAKGGAGGARRDVDEMRGDRQQPLHARQSRHRQRR